MKKILRPGAGGYNEIIDKWSSKYRVDTRLVTAVLECESSGRRDVVSKQGAIGLMQLMPPTADAMEVSNPFNPEENIFGGTRYLSLLLKRFRQDKTLAIAAYNAGPEAVEAHGGVPPFPETESFVAKVLDYHKQYASSEK